MLIKLVTVALLLLAQRDALPEAGTLDLIWQEPLAAEAEFTTATSEDGSFRVYLSQAGAVTAFDGQAGEQLWRTDLPSASLHSVRIAADRHGVILLPLDGSVIALDDSGQESWRREGRAEDWAQLLFLTANEEQIFLHSWLTGMVALNRQTGTELWQPIPLGGSVRAVLTDSTLVISHSESGAITIDVTRGFDPLTGAELWRHNRTTPLGVSDDEVFLHHNDYYFVPRSEVRTSRISTRTGEELALNSVLVTESNASPAVTLESEKLIIGQRVARRREWTFSGGGLQIVSECCFLHELFVAPMDANGPATSVAVDFPESARWLATSWPHAFVADVDSGELLRVNLETATTESLAQLDSGISLTAAEGATVALLTESNELVLVDLNAGSLARQHVPGSSAPAADFVHLEFAGNILLLQSEVDLFAFRRH